MERKILGSAGGLCQSIPSRKTLKDLSGRLGCASTQYQSVRAGRVKHGGILPPATMAEVRQLRHLQREKPEGANTAPGKSCASINSDALWAMYEWEPVAGQFQRCLLKYTHSQKWWQVTQSEKKKREKKLCQHRWLADAPQPPCALPLWALPEGDNLSCPKSEVLHQGYWDLQSPRLHQLRSPGTTVAISYMQKWQDFVLPPLWCRVFMVCFAVVFLGVVVWGWGFFLFVFLWGRVWFWFFLSFLFSIQNSAGSEQRLMVEMRTGKDYLVSKAGYCEGFGNVGSSVRA